MRIHLLRTGLNAVPSPSPPPGDVTYSILGTNNGSIWPATSFTGSVDVGAAVTGKHVYALLIWEGEAALTGGTLNSNAMTICDQGAGGGGRRSAIVQSTSPGSGSVAFSFTSSGWIGEIAVRWIAVFDGGATVTAMDGTIVQGNTVYGYNTACVFIKADFGNIQNTIVRRNYLLNDSPSQKTSYPFYSVDGSSYTATGTVFEDNIIEEGTYGFWSVNASITISGNTEYDPDNPPTYSGDPIS